MTFERQPVKHGAASDLARRSTLLGLACSLAFDRFMWMYRKYREDQLRDERGRFANEGSDEEPDTTGSLSPTYIEATGDPVIDGITTKLIGVASDVHDLLGEGQGMTYGRAFHNEFAARVRELGIPDLYVEVTYDKGVEMPYASPKAIRTDVILRTIDQDGLSVKAIWDLKTGGAEVSPARAREIREKVGVGLETPLIEIQTRAGIRIKETSDVMALWA